MFRESLWSSDCLSANGRCFYGLENSDRYWVGGGAEVGQGPKQRVINVF